MARAPALVSNMARTFENLALVVLSCLKPVGGQVPPGESPTEDGTTSSDSD